MDEHFLADVARWDVLIIDDEPDSRGVASFIFSHYDSPLREASSGAEGLALLHERLPTFVLLDIQMPAMSGWEVIAAIRADAELRAVPVIAFTAHAMHGDRERIIASGFDGYIGKPISPFTFVDEIRAILRQKYNSHSAEENPTP